jgi:hypothetical protein
LTGNVLRILGVLVDNIYELGASSEKPRQAANDMEIILVLGN